MSVSLDKHLISEHVGLRKPMIQEFVPVLDDFGNFFGPIVEERVLIS